MTSTQSTPRPDETPQERPAAAARDDKAERAEQDKSAEQEKPTGQGEKAEQDEKTGQTGPGSSARPQSTARATLHYTMLRLALFVACFAVLAVLAWLGVIPEGIGKSNPLWLFALAILISAPLSLVLLRKQRDAMSEQLVPKVERASSNLKGKLAENRGREDDV